MLRLDDGESGQLITPLTAEFITYVGATDEADSSPAYTSNNFVTDGTSLTEAISDLDAALSSQQVPIGTIIAFYDFNGALTFDTAVYQYCDGRTVTVAGIGLQTLPDLSNRYLVGFGTEGGGDIDTAAWATAAVGNASHQINIQHSHTVNAHDHDVNIASFTSGANGSHSHTVNSHTHTSDPHTHGPGSLTFSWGKWEFGGGAYTFYISTTGATFDYSFANTSASAGTGGASLDAVDTTPADQIFYTVDGSGTTASETPDPTGSSSPGTDTEADHTHTVNPPNTTSTTSSPGTDSQLSTTQSIQPRSIRVRFLMKIA